MVSIPTQARPGIVIGTEKRHYIEYADSLYALVYFIMTYFDEVDFLQSDVPMIF